MLKEKYVRTEEHKRKIALANTGKKHPHSEATKNKISNSFKNGLKIIKCKNCQYKFKQAGRNHKFCFVCSQIIKKKTRRARENKRYHLKLKFDIKYKINSSMGALIGRNIKGKNRISTYKTLGYDFNMLKNHLEKQFDDKMTWDNYGSYWQIDHIKPRSCFKFNNYNDVEFIKCWELKNLQPLSTKDNRNKSNKF